MYFVLVSEHSFIWQTQLYRFFILHLEFSITDFVSFLQFPLYLIFLPYGHFWLPFLQIWVLCWSVRIVLYDKLNCTVFFILHLEFSITDFVSFLQFPLYLIFLPYGHFWLPFLQIWVLCWSVRIVLYDKLNCIVFFILHLEFSITDFVSFLQFPLYLIFLPDDLFWLPFLQRWVLCWSVNIVLYDKLNCTVFYLAPWILDHRFC
jgi:hypothetical protein